MEELDRGFVALIGFQIETTVAHAQTMQADFWEEVDLATTKLERKEREIRE